MKARLTRFFGTWWGPLVLVPIEAGLVIPICYYVFYVAENPVPYLNFATITIVVLTFGLLIWSAKTMREIGRQGANNERGDGPTSEI